MTVSQNLRAQQSDFLNLKKDFKLELGTFDAIVTKGSSLPHLHTNADLRQALTVSASSMHMSAPCVVDMCFALPHLHTIADLPRVVSVVLDTATYMDEARYRVHVVSKVEYVTQAIARGE